MLTHLKIYNPRDNKYIEAKNNLVNNASNFYKGREKIIEGFKNKIFPIYYDEREEFREEDEEDEGDEQKKQEEKQEEQKEQDEKPFDLDEFIERIFNREKLPIKNELFKKHFKLEKPIIMHKVCTKQKIEKRKVN